MIVPASQHPPALDVSSPPQTKPFSKYKPRSPLSDSLSPHSHRDLPSNKFASMGGMERSNGGRGSGSGSGSSRKNGQYNGNAAAEASPSSGHQSSSSTQVHRRHGSGSGHAHLPPRPLGTPSPPIGEIYGQLADLSLRYQDHEQQAAARDPARQHRSPYTSGEAQQQQQQQQQQQRPSSVQLVFSDGKLLSYIIELVYADMLEYGREQRQAYLRRLTLVSKAWVEPVSARLYRNPYFGTLQRARAIHECLKDNQHRGRLVAKLIFGEGSNSDIKYWPTTSTVPDIVSLCPNVSIVGTGGLDKVDFEAFKYSLVNSSQLEEIRACDMMPYPYTNVTNFFNEIVQPCKKLSRMRLYGLHSEARDDGREGDDASSVTGSHHSSATTISSSCPSDIVLPDRLNRPLTDMALNHCSLNRHELERIFAGSRHTLQTLYMEYPMDLLDHDLLEILRLVDGGLRYLTIEGFTVDQENMGQRPDYMVHEIIKACPSLETLDFKEAIGSPSLFDALLGSKLRIWTFTCTRQVRPEHWIEAFGDPRFPKNAICRVYTTGWTKAEERRVRIAAWELCRASWLVNGDSLPESTGVMG